MATSDESYAQPNDAERHLVDSMALLGSLTGYISHELNNLLTPMRCYAELALRPGSDSTASKRALELAKEGSDRASRLVQSLLDLARRVPDIDNQQSTSVVESVDAALRFMPRNLSDDGIVVSCLIPTDLRVRLSCDLLDHLFMNLILNARTAMIPNGGTLEISARDCSPWNTPNQTATIVIRDTGRGFVEHDAATGRGQRTFGLDLCKRLVMHAQGTLSITSSIGVGTTCTMQLPSV